MHLYYEKFVVYPEVVVYSGKNLGSGISYPERFLMLFLSHTIFFHILPKSSYAVILQFDTIYTMQQNTHN